MATLRSDCNIYIKSSPLAAKEVELLSSAELRADVSKIQKTKLSRKD